MSPNRKTTPILDFLRWAKNGFGQEDFKRKVTGH
jgi:hypothetical protein